MDMYVALIGLGVAAAAIAIVGSVWYVTRPPKAPPRMTLPCFGDYPYKSALDYAERECGTCCHEQPCRSTTDAYKAAQKRLTTDGWAAAHAKHTETPAQRPPIRSMTQVSSLSREHSTMRMSVSPAPAQHDAWMQPIMYGHFAGGGGSDPQPCSPARGDSGPSHGSNHPDCGGSDLS